MRRFLCLTAAIAALAAVVAATWAQPVPVPAPVPAPLPKAETEPEPDYESTVPTLRFPYWGALSMDPHCTRENPSFRLIAALYDSLYTHVPGPAPSIVPALAADFPQISEDGLTWTIKLRPGIKYHNSTIFGDARTRDVKAQDVIDSLKRLAFFGNDEGMYWLISGVIEGLDEYGARARRESFGGTDGLKVPGLAAPDDLTLVLKLTRPFGSLLTMLAHPSTSVLPREAINHFGQRLAWRAVGTGPYRLHAVAPGQLIVLKRFEGFAGEPAGYERLMFVREEEYEDYYSGFAKGRYAEADMFMNSLAELFPEGKPGEMMKEAPGAPTWEDEAGMYFMAFNMEDPVWGALDDDGRALRKAVSLALDRNKLQLAAGFGEQWARPAHEPTPPGSEWYADALGHSLGATDAAAARKLLDASKYKGGFDPATGKSLVLTVALRNARMDQAIRNTLRDSLRPLGITVEPRILRGDYREAVRTDTSSMFFSGWFLDFPDAQNWLQLFHSANAGTADEYGNAARYKSAEFDALYAQLEGLAPLAQHAERRRELCSAMYALIARDRPFMPMFIRRYCTLRSNQVQWPELPRATHTMLRLAKPVEAAKPE